MSEYNNRGVVLDPRFPVMPIILISAALILQLIAIIILVDFAAIIFTIAMLLMLLGMALHRKKLQLLTGIGSLLLATFHFFATVIMLYGFPYAADSMNIINVFINLLTVAGFTVTGLHYVLRRPKPGKAAKLILMIPLACCGLITMIVNMIRFADYGSIAVTYALVCGLSSFISVFALMIYTPFREA